LFGDQRVFQSEATGAAQVVAGRFGADPTIVKFNNKKGGDATTTSLAATLRATGKNMDDANDVLFLILTSHGSPDGLAVVAGRRQETLTPAHLADMLNATHVRYRAVVISACYSGVFIPWLANPNSLVVTAADANHSSFGCEDRAKWTYFGDAFFNVALRRTTRLKDAFALARALVRQREARNGFVPSHPQMAGGENVEPLLIARP
jgi:Peptidase C13 family